MARGCCGYLATRSKASGAGYNTLGYADCVFSLLPSLSLSLSFVCWLGKNVVVVAAALLKGLLFLVLNPPPLPLVVFASSFHSPQTKGREIMLLLFHLAVYSIHQNFLELLPLCCRNVPFLEKLANISVSGRHVGNMSATFPAKQVR